MKNTILVAKSLIQVYAYIGVVYTYKHMNAVCLSTYHFLNAVYHFLKNDAKYSLAFLVPRLALQIHVYV